MKKIILAVCMLTALVSANWYGNKSIDKIYIRGSECFVQISPAPSDLEVYHGYQLRFNPSSEAGKIRLATLFQAQSIGAKVEITTGDVVTPAGTPNTNSAITILENIAVVSN